MSKPTKILLKKHLIKQQLETAIATMIQWINNVFKVAILCYSNTILVLGDMNVILQKSRHTISNLITPTHKDDSHLAFLLSLIFLYHIFTIVFVRHYLLPDFPQLHKKSQFRPYFPSPYGLFSTPSRMQSQRKCFVLKTHARTQTRNAKSLLNKNLPHLRLYNLLYATYNSRNNKEYL